MGLSEPLKEGYVMFKLGDKKLSFKSLYVPGVGWCPITKELSEDFTNIPKGLALYCPIDAKDDDIKSWITEKHHYYCYSQEWIDDYSLDCIERRYKQFDKNVRLFHKHLANVAYEENNKGIYTDFFDFVDTLSPIEQKNLQVLLHKYTTVRISFNSK